MPFLLDTNLISEAVKKQPDRKVISWSTQVIPQSYVSAITMGELQRGILTIPQSKRKDFYTDWFADVEALYEGAIISVYPEVMRTRADYAVELQKNGLRISPFDSLIAATALTHSLTVVTRNVKDFPDVPVLNPWS